MSSDFVETGEADGWASCLGVMVWVVEVDAAWVCALFVEGSPINCVPYCAPAVFSAADAQACLLFFFPVNINSSAPTIR